MRDEDEHSAMKTYDALLLAVGLGLLAPPLHADELRLRNGDRISGTVVHKSGTDVVVRTDYAGDITVRWDQVLAITTSHPIRLQARGAEAVARVRLHPGAAGEATLEPPIDGSATLPLSRIAFLNPTPAESGEGMVLSGRLTFSFASTRGNTDTSHLYGEADLAGEAKRSRFSLVLSADQQQGDNETTAERARASGDYDYFIAANRFLYGRTSLEHDRFADLRLRSTVGAGYGWQLRDTPDTTLSLRSGLDYVMVNHMEAPDEHFPALGFGVKFKHRPFGRRFELFHEADGYWNLKRREDLTVITRTGLRVPIVAGLQTTAQVNLDWDGDPAEGRRSLDTTLLLGAGYEW